MEDYIKQKTGEFLDKMGVDYLVDTVFDSKTNSYKINIKTKDSGILIGYRGSNIHSLKLLLKLILTSKHEYKDLNIDLDINNYIKQRDQKLYKSIKEKLNNLAYGGELILEGYSAFERKKIHSYIHSLDDDSYSTESIGVGKNRKLHIYKKNNIKIDLDRIGI